MLSLGLWPGFDYYRSATHRSYSNSRSKKGIPFQSNEKALLSVYSVFRDDARARHVCHHTWPLKSTSVSAGASAASLTPVSEYTCAARSAFTAPRGRPRLHRTCVLRAGVRGFKTRHAHVFFNLATHVHGKRNVAFLLFFGRGIDCCCSLNGNAVCVCVSRSFFYGTTWSHAPKGERRNRSRTRGCDGP